MPNTYQKKKILTISVAHFFHDIYSAFFAPMLPLLMQNMGLSLSSAGILDIARRAPSMATPLIGYIADKKSIKYLIIISPAITAVSMSLLGLASNYWLIFMLLFIAGISNICFHVPSPVLIKQLAGNNIGKGMSQYMSWGAIAGTVGTFIVTLVITYLGLDKVYLLMLFGIATSVVLLIRFKNITAVEKKETLQSYEPYHSVRSFIPFFIVLAFIMLFRAGMTLSLTLYLPVYLTDKGNSLWFAGISLSILHLAGALGMISIGHISDKFCKKKILIILIMLSVISMWVMIFFSRHKYFVIPCLILLGMLLFSSAPVILALVQHLKSYRPSFVNSIYFFLGFVINSTCILFVGFMGDNIGLDSTFKICATLPLCSVPFLIFLPDYRNF